MIRLSIFIAAALLILGPGCGTNNSMQKNLSAEVPAAYTLTYTQRQGQNLFGTYCAVCHGSGGQGDGFNAYNLDPRPRDLTDSNYMAIYSPERLVEVLMQGGRGINKSVAMPAWGNTLRSYQIEYLVDYLMLLSSGTVNIE